MGFLGLFLSPEWPRVVLLWIMDSGSFWAQKCGVWVCVDRRHIWILPSEELEQGKKQDQAFLSLSHPGKMRNSTLFNISGAFLDCGIKLMKFWGQKSDFCIYRNKYVHGQCCGLNMLEQYV